MSKKRSPMLMTRYLTKNLLLAAALIALSLTMVIWLTQSLRLLELVANSDAPPGMFIKMVALTLPKFLEITLPLSLVTAVLFIYNKMIMDNELIVLRSCGFDQFMLARPALLVAGGLTILLLCLTTFISPRSYAEMHVMRQNIKAQYSSFLLREGVFNTFSDNLTVYLRARSPEGDLLGLMIHDTRDKEKPPVTVTAKRGRISMDGDTPNIIVYDGMRQQMDVSSDVVSKLFFSRYTIEIKGLDAGGDERWREASERTLIELFNPDMTNKTDRNFKDVFTAEAHHRMVTPFNAVAFVMVALCGVLLGPFNRRGQNKKVMFTVVAIIALQTLNLVFVNAAKKHLGFVPLIYFSTFTPIILCGWLLHIRGEQWLMNTLRDLRAKSAMKLENRAI